MRSPRPAGASPVVPSEGPMWASAPTKRRESCIDHPGQRRRASVCGADGRKGRGLRQRSSPKGPATSDNPSVSLRLTAPFTQGSLGDGGCGLPRRPCRPPRNDNGFLSFRGAKRRGNPSFFTMDDGRGFGLPHERRGDGQVVVPGGGRGKAAGLMGGFAGKIRLGGNFGGFFLLWGAKYPGKALQSQKKYDILAS